MVLELESINRLVYDTDYIDVCLDTPEQNNVPTAMANTGTEKMKHTYICNNVNERIPSPEPPFARILD